MNFLIVYLFFQFSLNISSGGTESLPAKSTGSTPLPCWTGYSVDDTPNTDINFVNYVLIRQILTNQKKPIDDQPKDRCNNSTDWSFPARLVANENTGRVTVSIPIQSEHLVSLPLCIVGQTRHGVSYFVIKEDKSPSCLLYNYTTVPIVYGYQNLSISRAGMLIISP